MPEPYSPGPGFRLNSPPGFRLDPLNPMALQRHGGVDWAAAPGTQIHSASDGTVWFSGFSSSYGNTLIIDYGTSTTGARIFGLYAHLSDNQRLTAGAAVSTGDIIGLVGNQAENSDRGTRWTGPHLHYEVWAIFPGSQLPTQGDFGTWPTVTGTGIDPTVARQYRVNPLRFEDYPSGNSFSPMSDRPTSLTSLPYDLGLGGADAPASFEDQANGTTILHFAPDASGRRNSITIDLDGFVLNSETVSQSGIRVQQTNFDSEGAHQTVFNFDNSQLWNSRHIDIGADATIQGDTRDYTTVANQWLAYHTLPTGNFSKADDDFAVNWSADIERNAFAGNLANSGAPSPFSYEAGFGSGYDFSASVLQLRAGQVDTVSVLNSGFGFDVSFSGGTAGPMEFKVGLSIPFNVFGDGFYGCAGERGNLIDGKRRATRRRARGRTCARSSHRYRFTRLCPPLTGQIMVAAIMMGCRGKAII